MLADVVDAHVRRVQQAGHRGGVDDVALVGRVLRGGLQHHRREHAHAVHHAHQVDAEHPVPVLQRVLPDQPADADTGVVEHEAGRAEARQRGRAQRLDLGCLRHVQPERQHRRAGGGDLGSRPVQRILLHVGHDHVHALARGDARGLEAETGRRTGDDGRAALEMLHVLSALIWKPNRGKCTCTVPARASLRRSTDSCAVNPTKRTGHRVDAVVGGGHADCLAGLEAQPGFDAGRGRGCRGGRCGERFATVHRRGRGMAEGKQPVQPRTDGRVVVQ